MIIVAIENAKLKLLKVLSSYNNAIYDSVKPFLQQLTLETCGLWTFSENSGVILRFRRISFNMPQGFMRMPRYLDLDLGLGIHTRIAKMSDWGGRGEFYHYSLFALECAYIFPFFASNGSTIFRTSYIQITITKILRA